MSIAQSLIDRRKGSHMAAAIFVVRTANIASPRFIVIEQSLVAKVARTARVRVIKWMKISFKSTNSELLLISLPVASGRHLYFLPVTSENYMKST